MRNKGFTLIELAVVLAIIAVLAAVLTPVVTGYLDQARVTRAAADVRTIADAVKLYKTDTGVYPFFNSSAAATEPVTTTDIAGDSDYVASSGGTDLGLTATAGTSLETYLNTNVMSRTTSATVIGRARYNGPYIGAIDADAWGNKYYVKVDNLDATLNSGNGYWAWVGSAGPDAAFHATTTGNQGRNGTFSVGGDDIAVPLR